MRYKNERRSVMREFKEEKDRNENDAGLLSELFVAGAKGLREDAVDGRGFVKEFCQDNLTKGQCRSGGKDTKWF